MNHKLKNKTIVLALISVFLLGCGSSNDKTSNDTQGDIAFIATLTTHWNGSDYPTLYPSNAHWSPLTGTVHNEQIVFWEAQGQPATLGVESVAETGSTSSFESEIQRAKDSGYSQGLVKTTSISNGSGSVSIEFSTTDTYPLLTLLSMIAPSPDWFVGVNSLSLKDNNDEWIDNQTILLKLYDAGTDNGSRFTSADIDTSSDSSPITLLSSHRSDTDFEEGVHFSSGQHVATLTIERL